MRVIIGLLFFLLLLGFAGDAVAATDTETILEESGRAQAADHASWAAFAFHRHVTRQSLDSEGAVKSRQELHFQVTPAEDGFDELLVEIDGRAPTTKEVKEHRKKRRFTNHYTQSATLELENPLGEAWALMPLIYDQEHRLVGEEEIDGIPCHRVEFDAHPETKGASADERMRSAMKGSACIAVDGYHLVEAQLETVRPVKKGPASLHYLRLHFENRPVGDAWLPTLIEMRSDVKIPGMKFSKSNKYQYTEYRRATDER